MLAAEFTNWEWKNCEDCHSMAAVFFISDQQFPNAAGANFHHLILNRKFCLILAAYSRYISLTNMVKISLIFTGGR